MKRTALLVSVLSFLFVPSVASAEVDVQISNNESSSEVHIQSESQGTSTICQNGKCTTTGGTNTSTVCVNGECKTSDKDVNYASEDGTTKVNITTNGSNVEVGPTTVPSVASPTPTEPQPTITVDPEIEKEIAAAQRETEIVQERLKKRFKDQESFLDAFIKAEIASLQKILDGFFH